MFSDRLRTLNSTYNNHFQLLLHASLSTLPIIPHLKAYLASTLNTTTNVFPPPPSTTLYRLGFLPRYSDLLVEIAFKEIERVVSNVSADKYQTTTTTTTTMDVPIDDPTIQPPINAHAGPSNSRPTSIDQDTTPSPKSLGKRPLTAEDGDDHTEPLDDADDTIMEADDPGPWGTSRLDDLMKEVTRTVFGWVLSYTTRELVELVCARNISEPI